MGQVDVEEIKEIYSLLGDDISRYIFENRLMYSLTGDMKFIRNVVCTIPKGREMYERLRTSQKKIGIFGAGDVGRHLIHVYTDIEFVSFIDNKRAGTVYEGLPVISLPEFKEKYPEGIILISTKLFYKEILAQLTDENIKDENVLNLGAEYEKLNHLQYFDLPQLREREVTKEVFVDGGCYDGASSIDFKKWCLGGAEVFAWEPDPSNQVKCRQLFSENALEFQLISKGLWSTKRELRLKAGGTGSVISDDGDMEIEVDCIDCVIKKPVTFIKMDIEGAEYEALLGARKTILKYKPKLAICIYHKSEDIWEIPGLIHKLNPGYQFYLRHYSFADNETVLYAL